MKAFNRVIVTILLLLNTLTGMSQDRSYNLKGKINTAFDGQKIVLFAFDNDTILKVDTTIINNGSFNFKGYESVSDMSILSVGNYPDSVLYHMVVLERGNIEVSMLENRIAGTPLNDLYQFYLDTTAVLYNQLDEIAKLEGAKDGLVKKGSLLEKKYIEIGKYSVDFKKKNINNVVGQHFFENETGRLFAEMFAYPSSTGIDSVFLTIYESTDSTYRKRKWIQDYLTVIVEKEKKRLSQENKTGQLFSDFTLIDAKGNEHRISDYIGNTQFVVLDFWASWCGPCIQAFPEMKKFYERYDRSQLEIIGISLDTNLNSWIKATNEQNIGWIQLIANNTELQNKLLDAYSFQGIPFTVLIDNNGSILTSGHALELLNIADQLIN